MKSTKADKKPKSRKGEAARAKLKAAATRVLGRMNCHQMRIVDVTGEAGVATGLFYHYFPDLNALLYELANEFVDRFDDFKEIEEGVEKGDWFGRILSHTRFVVGCYATQPELTRCVFDLAASDTDLRERWRHKQYQQLQALVELMPRIFPGSSLSPVQNEIVVYGLGSIGEGLLRDYYVNRSQTVIHFELEEDELAEWLAVIFYRGLFGENPPDGKLNFSERILTLHL